MRLNHYKINDNFRITRKTISIFSTLSLKFSLYLPYINTKNCSSFSKLFCIFQNHHIELRFCVQMHKVMCLRNQNLFLFQPSQIQFSMKRTPVSMLHVSTRVVLFSNPSYSFHIPCYFTLFDLMIFPNA